MNINNNENKINKLNNSNKKGENNMSKTIDIKGICAEFGLSQVYVRKMMNLGKIKSRKVKISANVYKNVFDYDEIVKWRKSCGQKPIRRTDGRQKWTMYTTPEEMKEFEQFMKQKQLGIEVKRANKVKPSN